LKSPDCDRPDGGLPFSDNDWMLASTCLAPVMFVGPRELGASPRIAAAVDASLRERPGLGRAILDLADSIRARLNGQLEVVACVPVPREEMQHANARKFNDLVSDLKLGEHAHLLSGDPEAVLPSFASARGYDILVMGALSHRAAPAPVIGSLTGKLIGSLDCDFVLVKPDTLALRRAQPGG
jgi:nucleotide-binding universal stress UspA family protein